MSTVYISPNERVDDLQTPNGLRLIQNPSWFCFGVDAVLLCDFAKSAVKPKSRVLDMCTGNGIVPILLSEKTEADQIIGLEIQSQVAEMANRSVLLNGLENRITITEGDLKEAYELYSARLKEMLR